MAELIGYMGMVLIAISYILINLNIIRNSILYNIMVLVGCILLGYNLYMHQSYPALIVQSIISIFASVYIMRWSINSLMNK